MRKSAWEKTQEELLQERAEVLGRAGEALSAALSDLEKIGRSITERFREAGEYPGHARILGQRKPRVKRPRAGLRPG